MVPSPCHATSTFFPSYKESLGAPATLAPLPSPSQPPPALSLSPLPLFFPLPSRPWPRLEPKAHHHLAPPRSQRACPVATASTPLSFPHLGALFPVLGISETSSPRACSGTPSPAAVDVPACTRLPEPLRHVQEVCADAYDHQAKGIEPGIAAHIDSVHDIDYVRQRGTPRSPSSSSSTSSPSALSLFFYSSPPP